MNDPYQRDALDILRADHVRVKSLFRDFEKMVSDDDDSDARTAELVDDICYELTVHAMIEEEIFYPALRAATDATDLLDDADIDHAGARELVSQLEVMYPGDEHFDATVTVLGEEVQHHFDEEENVLFAAARESGIDLQALGRRLRARKQALEDDLSSPPASFDPQQPHAGTRKAPRAPN